MKELSTEQKAQRYNEAIAYARLLLKTIGNATLGNLVLKNEFENMFPELKESEDERIRKCLIDLVNGIDTPRFYGIDRKAAIAWLEKQGEPTEINPSEFDSQLNRLLGQFKSLPKEELASSLSFYLNVVQNNGTYKEEKQGEQKPNANCLLNWSEEDEYIIEEIEAIIDAYVLEENNPKALIDWLKSLRPQNTWRPSDEQMKALEHFVRSIGESGYASPYDNDTKLLYSLLFDLKKLRGE